MAHFLLGGEDGHSEKHFQATPSYITLVHTESYKGYFINITENDNDFGFRVGRVSPHGVVSVIWKSRHEHKSRQSALYYAKTWILENLEALDY